MRTDLREKNIFFIMVMYNLFTHVLSLIQVEQELAMAKKTKKTKTTP